MYDRVEASLSFVVDSLPNLRVHGPRSVQIIRARSTSASDEYL